MTRKPFINRGIGIFPTVASPITAQDAFVRKLETALREVITASTQASHLDPQDMQDFTRKLNAILGVLKKNSSADINWLLGDLYNEIHALHKAARKRDKTSDILGDFLTASGIQKSTFESVRWVARKFAEPDRHLPDVDWAHYRRAAGTKDPLAEIKQASQSKWTTRQFRDYLASQKPVSQLRAGRACDNGCGNRTVRKHSPVVKNVLPKQVLVFCSLDCLVEYMIDLLTSNIP